MSEFKDLAAGPPALTVGGGEVPAVLAPRQVGGAPILTEESEEQVLAIEIISGDSKVRYSVKGKIYHACKRCSAVKAIPPDFKKAATKDEAEAKGKKLCQLCKAMIQAKQPSPCEQF
jgi:hypothetical protein